MESLQYFADDLPENIRAKFGCGDQAKAIDGYNAENKYEDAHNTYKYLSAECRNAKPMIISYLKTCTADSSAELAGTADDALRSHPKDPIIALNLIDCYYALERYDAILKCISIVDSTVQDPQLDYIRANVYFAKNDFETALKLFYTIGENQPGSIRTDAWKSIVNIKIYQNKPEEALAVCKMLVTSPLTLCPMNGRPFSTTTIVPSSK